jgi:hypothetical protein
VKKLEKGETVAHAKLHKKRVPSTTREANNKNKEKGETSSINVFALMTILCPSKEKRGEEK